MNKNYERKQLDLSPLKTQITPKDIRMKASLDVNIRQRKALLTQKQRDFVDKATEEVVVYTIMRAKQVTAEEWLQFGKYVTLAVIAAIRKDKVLLVKYLKELGDFFLKHFLPDFIYSNDVFTICKVGEKVEFDLIKKP